MNRYNDDRGSRRRGFGDDFPPRDNDFGSRPFQSRGPMAPPPPSGPPMQATVKWFNVEKRFGFVELENGTQAFMHVRPLEAAGFNSVPEGATLRVRVADGQKGPQVTEVLEVDTSTASPVQRAPRSFDGGPRGGMGGGGGMGRSGGGGGFQRPTGPTEEKQGTVKWYNPEKGFGFIAPEEGGKDIFVHVTALERSGLSDLAEGQRVRMAVRQSPKGLEAQSIETLD